MQQRQRREADVAIVVKLTWELADSEHQQRTEHGSERQCHQPAGHLFERAAPLLALHAYPDAPQYKRASLLSEEHKVGECD